MSSIHEELWNKATKSKRVSAEAAREVFEDMIKHHKGYKKGDESGVKYLVLWLEYTEDGNSYIQVDDFYKLWSLFGQYIFNKEKGDEVTYLKDLSLLIKEIYNCSGFVNTNKCENLPECYYCVRKDDKEQLVFEYTYGENKYQTIEITYSKGGFGIKQDPRLKITSLKHLINLISTAVTTSCGKGWEVEIPDDSIIGYSLGDGEFYFITEQGKEKRIDICEASSSIKNINKMPKCEISVMYGISRAGRSVMYAPWNTKSGDFPNWFNKYVVNVENVNSFMIGNPSPTLYFQILKQQMVDHIEEIFGNTMRNFVENFYNFLVSDVTGSLLPYAMYRCFGKKIAIIEVNNETTISVSGYGKLGNRVYERFTADEDNIESISDLLNEFEKIDENDVVFITVANFYSLEEQPKYVNGNLETKIEMIESLIATLGLPKEE